MHISGVALAAAKECVVSPRQVAGGWFVLGCLVWWVVGGWVVVVVVGWRVGGSVSARAVVLVLVGGWSVFGVAPGGGGGHLGVATKGPTLLRFFSLAPLAPTSLQLERARSRF